MSIRKDWLVTYDPLIICLLDNFGFTIIFLCISFILCDSLQLATFVV